MFKKFDGWYSPATGESLVKTHHLVFHLRESRNLASPSIMTLGSIIIISFQNKSIFFRVFSNERKQKRIRGRRTDDDDSTQTQDQLFYSSNQSELMSEKMEE